jgi:hypothetical protein
LSQNCQYFCQHCCPYFCQYFAEIIANILANIWRNVQQSCNIGPPGQLQPHRQVRDVRPRPATHPQQVRRRQPGQRAQGIHFTNLHFGRKLFGQTYIFNLGQNFIKLFGQTYIFNLGQNFIKHHQTKSFLCIVGLKNYQKEMKGNSKVLIANSCFGRLKFLFVKTAEKDE